MAIVANFTADVVSGDAPLTVTFTDTSSGSPDAWLWDFGDGQGSESQSPVHIYEEEGTFTVTLKAYIKTGSTEVVASLTSPLLKSANSSTEAAAYAAFLIASFTTGNAFIEFEFRSFSSSSKTYFAQKSTPQFDLTSHPSGIAILKYRAFFFESSTNGSRFKIKISGGGIVPDVFVFSSGNTGNTDFPNVIVGDISDKLGTLFSYDILAADDFTVRVGLAVPGATGTWRLRLPAGSPNPVRLDVNTFSDLDTEIKTDFIQVGDLPIAAFSGTPRKKKNSLTVQFTDESTESPTSWSWKRRPSGIEASYVEFSTDENPSENFDVEVP